MPSITVAVIAKNGIIRDGIQAQLSRTVSKIRLIGFRHIADFVNTPRQDTVDIIIWDDPFEDTASTHHAVLALTQSTSAALIVISKQINFTYITQLVQQGVLGVIHQQDVRDEVLQDALRCVIRGAVYFSPSVTPVMSNGQMVALSLNKREKQVLQLMAAGHSIPDIAHQLHLSERTVYRYRRQLREALGVPTNEQIIDAARQYGLIDAG